MTTAVELRPYQRAAADAVTGAFAIGKQRVLVVMPTGTGKTVVFAELARDEVRRGGRVLVLAHRTELLDQALRKLREAGIEGELEQGKHRARAGAPVVVASVATLLRAGRHKRWGRETFALIIVDEAHHAVADGYRSILDWFDRARVVGVTATPDRLDGAALGAAFDACPYQLGIREAIRDGWLASISARRVRVDGVDLAGVHTRGGDLDQAELAAELASEKALHGVAKPLLELAGDRRTILFAVNVAHAHALAEVLNRYQHGVARAVDGNADPDERAAALVDFRGGAFRVLVNCALFIEGFDEPSIACVAIARPTKSRALYTQMLGRGTRPAPGKVDCLVLDFTGIAGRHRLIGPVDVLAGAAVADDVLAIAAAELDAGVDDLDELLEAAQETARRSAVTAVARYVAEKLDPFVGDLPPFPPTSWSSDPATPSQREVLAEAGLKELPAQLTKGDASRLIRGLNERRAAGLCSLKQAKLLRGFGYDPRALTSGEAGKLIGELATNGWRRWPARSA